MKNVFLFWAFCLVPGIVSAQSFLFSDLLASRSSLYQADSANIYLFVNGGWQLDSTSSIVYYPNGSLKEIRGFRISENRFSRLEFYPDGFPMLAVTFVPNSQHTIERYTAIRRGANFLVIEKGIDMLIPFTFPIIDSLVWVGTAQQPTLVRSYSRSLQPNAQPILETEYNNISYTSQGLLKAYTETRQQDVREFSSLNWPGVYPGTLDALTKIHHKLMARTGFTGFLGNFRWPAIYGYGKTTSYNGIVFYQYDYNSPMDTFCMIRKSGATNQTLLDDGFRIRHNYNSALQREHITSYHQYSPTQIQAYQTQRYEVDPGGSFLVFDLATPAGYFRYDSLSLEYAGQTLRQIQFFQNTTSTVISPRWKVEFFQAGFALGESVKEKRIQTSLHLYPNPAESELTIVLPESGQAATLEVFSLAGKKVLTYSEPEGQATMRLALDELQSGLYYVRLHQRNTSFTGRFLKTK